jgi:predicted transcriptional regulator of viral defense system
MTTQRTIEMLQEQGGVLRASTLRRAGVHSRTLTEMSQAGLLERVSRGLYRLREGPPSSNTDLVIVTRKSPSAIICLISALAHHGLTTQIPHRVEIAIAPGARTPVLEHPPITAHRFSGDALSQGVETHVIDGVSIRIFGEAKSIADCFKFRNKIGLDVALEALRAYLRRNTHNVDELLHFARIDRVHAVMMPYVEAML